MQRRPPPLRSAGPGYPTRAGLLADPVACARAAALVTALALAGCGPEATAPARAGDLGGKPRSTVDPVPTATPSGSATATVSPSAIPPGPLPGRMPAPEAFPEPLPGAPLPPPPPQRTTSSSEP